MCIGMECLDELPDGEYSMSELPTWVRDKLAALSIMHIPPPPTDVVGIGTRISEYVFWVYP